MTDDPYPDGTGNHPDDQQQAIEACQHAAGRSQNGDLAPVGRSLHDEAQVAVERAEHDDTPHAGTARNGIRLLSDIPKR